MALPPIYQITSYAVGSRVRLRVRLREDELTGPPAQITDILAAEFTLEHQASKRGVRLSLGNGITLDNSVTSDPALRIEFETARLEPGGHDFQIMVTTDDEGVLAPVAEGTLTLRRKVRPQLRPGASA
jgi:hypothetical protein